MLLDTRCLARFKPSMKKLAIIALSFAATPMASAESLVIAPMIQGADYCQQAAAEGVTPDEAGEFCYTRKYTTSSRLESELSKIGPPRSPNGEVSLGYTLSIPLLRYFEKDGSRWSFDHERLYYALSTLREVNRPTVIYLFSTHFTTDKRPSSLEQELSRDPKNLMTFAGGKIARDTYFNAAINPWTISNLEAPINQYRAIAIREVIKAVCELPAETRSRVVGFNLLGEIHHLFPNFFAGQGYESGMTTTDYSPVSIYKFQSFLRSEFGTIDNANQRLQTSFKAFSEIQPPSKDIKTDRLTDFSDHLDPYAHGTFPVSGWAFSKSDVPYITVLLNGVVVAAGKADAGRQDVLDARPEFGSANVGFRFDIPFKALPPGIHQLTVNATVGDATMRIAQRDVVIMDRDQTTPGKITPHPVKSYKSLSENPILEAWTDYPKDLQAFYYNPLADLWLQYRNKQVRDYIDHFTRVASEGCFGTDKLFSHQIAPRFNASWNADLIAADKALEPSNERRLGINLYGGAAYGTTFFDWIKHADHGRYGVPEFHPMRKMTEEAVGTMFRKHKESGAAYIAPYFISMIPHEFLHESDRDHLRFMLSPDNQEYGSASFFDGLRRLMQQ